MNTASQSELGQLLTDLKQSGNSLKKITKNIKTLTIYVATLFVLFAFILLITPAKANTPADFIAKNLKATFKNTTFTNIGTTTIDGLWQAEISNEVVYFAPKAEVMIFGQMYSKNGVNLTEQAKQKWQSKRINKLDISDALIIGNDSITIIEFTDPDCPFCYQFDKWVNNQADITRKIIFTPTKLEIFKQDIKKIFADYF